MSAVRLARGVARRVLRRSRPAKPLALRPFLPVDAAPAGVKRCNVCTWQGLAFLGIEHCESSVCPRCGAIGRDRWLFHCLVSSVTLTRETRLLETSPRLGEPYRLAMAQRLRYLASDYDQRNHRTDVTLDLQAIDLPDASLDVVVTSHVLEHVPDTAAALAELHRVLAPGGHLLLLVPVLQGATAPPDEPEFHGDSTPVFWRFGPDLTEQLRKHGFETRLLCTADLARRVETRDASWPGVAGEWDAASIVAAVDPADLTVVCDDATAATIGTEPSYMYLAWHARKPG